MSEKTKKNNDMADKQQRIGNYISGRMDKAQQANFEAEMQQDTALEQEVRLAMLERQAAVVMLQQDFQKKIQEFRAGMTEATTTMEVQEEETPKQEAVIRKLKPMRKWWAMAATVLFLVVAGGLWYANAQFSNGNMALAYLEVAEMGGDKGSEVEDVVYLKGLVNFQKEDYTAAIQDLKNVDTANENYLAAKYYLGYSYLYTEQFGVAEKEFEFLLTQEKLPVFVDIEALQWNRLLAYLGDKGTDETFQQELEKFVQTASPVYREKVAELKREVSNFWRRLVF